MYVPVAGYVLKHALRRQSGIEEAGTRRTISAHAHRLALQLREIGKIEHVVQSLVSSIRIGERDIVVQLNTNVLGNEADAGWSWSIPLQVRRPFREARLRIDSETDRQHPSNDLLGLIADAMAAQRLILASPELSLVQLAKRERRCRTQLARLLRLSWMSPRIIEAIAAGTQPQRLTRRALLICDMPIDWAEQEQQFGFAA